MKRPKKYLTITLLILASASMAFSQDNPDNNSVFEKLVGTWIWFKSNGGIPETTWTPSTIGYNLTLEISKDSIYRMYKDNKLQYESKVTIDLNEDLKGNGLWQAIYFKGQDTLILNDICPDCSGNFYIRKK